MTKKFLAFALSTTILCSAAIAGEAETTRIETLFQSMINQSTDTQISPAGDILVEDAKGYYAVTLPQLTYTDENGAKINLGILSANVTAHEDPKQWKMSLSIPTPITSNGAGGEQTSRIDIASQSVSGIWNENLEGFSKFKAALGNISIASHAFKTPVTVKNLAAHSDLNSADQKLWSGDLGLNLAEFSSSNLNIANFSSLLTLEAYDPRATKNSIMKLPAAPDAAFDAAPYVPAKSLLADIKAEGLSHTLKGQNTTITADNFSLMLRAQNIRSNNAEAHITFSAKGLKNAGDPLPYSQIFPAYIDLDIRPENIPVHDLVKIFAAMKFPQSGLSIFNIPAALSSALANIKITQTRFGNDKYSVSINGTVNAKQPSIFGTIADINIDITGLDYLLSVSQVMASQGNQTDIEFHRRVAQVLEKIKTFATVRNENGTFIHNVKITLNEYGALMMNELSLFQLFQDFPACTTCSAAVTPPPESASGLGAAAPAPAVEQSN